MCNPWPLVLGLLSLLLTAALPATAQDKSLSVSIVKDERRPEAGTETVQLYGKSYALVIGNDKYSAGWPRLSNAINDAKAVADTLKEQGFDVRMKTDLTSDDLHRTLQDFFIETGADPQARLLVWFAGHGHTIANEGYLVPIDAPVAEQSVAFRRKALSLRRFGEYMREAQSRHVLAVFDSCFAGTVFQTARSMPPPMITAATALPVRQFISAGDASQEVSDDGMFRRLFISALKGEEPTADANRDGYITGTELGLFLSDKITNLTRNAQTPRYGKLREEGLDRGDFVFRVDPLGIAGLSKMVSNQPQDTRPAPKRQPIVCTAPAPAFDPNKNSNWVKLCEQVAFKNKGADGKVSDEKRSLCLTHHERLDGSNGQVVSAALRQVAGSDAKTLMVMVPIGMAIQPGIRVGFYPFDRWDTKQMGDPVGSVDLKYTLCNYQGCTGEIEATEEIVKALQTCGGAMVLSLNPQGEPIAFPLPLEGFTRTLNGPPIDNQVYTKARAELFDQIRKRQWEAAAQANKQAPVGTNPQTPPPAMSAPGSGKRSDEQTRSDSASRTALVQPPAPAPAAKPRGWLGLKGTEELTKTAASAAGLSEQAKGVRITELYPNSPATQSGLKTGDIVTRFNGTPVADTADLVRRVGDTTPGSRIELTIWRDRSEQTLVATLRAAATPAAAPAPRP